MLDKIIKATCDRCNTQMNVVLAEHMGVIHPLPHDWVQRNITYETGGVTAVDGSDHIVDLCPMCNQKYKETELEFYLSWIQNNNLSDFKEKNHD